MFALLCENVANSFMFFLQLKLPFPTKFSL